MTDQGQAKVYRSTFGRSFTARFEPYSGIDFSTVCLVFPAQSSAHPGMFRRELREFDEFSELFARADEFARVHDLCAVSLYISNPDRIPAAQLPAARTLSLFTAQYAMFRRLIGQGVKPSAVTGHSFGEFAAVSASGSVGFDEMLSVVLAREHACPGPHELGWLISIAAPFSSLSELLGQSACQYAAMNSPRQTLIGVPGLAEAEDIEKKLKARAVAFQRLENVPHPYHTPYMKDCGARFSGMLSALSLHVQAPAVPLYSSVLHCRVDSGNFTPDLIISALAGQMTESIDFIEQIGSIHRDGIYGFLEVGPGSVFSKLSNDILKGKAYSIIPVAPWLSQEPDVVREYDIKDHRLLRRITDVISRLTGYELQKIQIRKRLQDDLGIDSIKKAEILFTVLEEEEVRDAAAIITSEIRTVYDIGEAVSKAKYADRLIEPFGPAGADFIRHRLSWEEQGLSSLPSRQGPPFEKVLALSVSSLMADPVRYLDVTAGRAVNCDNLLVILDFDRGDDGDSVDEAVRFMMAVKKLFERFARPFFLVASSRRESLLFCGATSLFKSLRKELGYFQFVSMIAGRDADISALAAQAASELYHRELRYSGDERFVQKLKPESICAGDDEKSSFEGSVIVVIGGAKGTTFSLLSRLVQEFSVTVEVIGRSGPDASPVPEHMEALARGKGRVQYHQCDASSADGLHALLHRIHRAHGRIDYIIDGAGFQVSAPFSGRSVEEISRELASKIAVAENVLRLGEMLSVKKAVCFSSIVGWAGNGGQAVYAFSNGALNCLAERSPVPALSIMWPPWKGVGMMDDERLTGRMEGMGISLLDEERAYALFREDLISGSSRGTLLYHDPSNTSLYRSALTSLKEYQPLVGTFMYHRDMTFQLDITAESHPFIRDHSLKGSLYLSFSYVTALLQFQLYFLTGAIGTFRNLRLFNPISVGDGAVVACHFKPAAEGSFNVSINSMRYGHNVVFSHGSGTIEPDEPDGAAQMKCVPERGFDEYLRSLRKLNPPQIYGRQGLFHGPAYQVLHEIQADGEGCYVSCLPPSEPAFTGHRAFDRVVAAVEASVQLAAFRSYHERQIYTLPEAVEFLHMDDRRDSTGPLYLKLMTIAYQEEEVKADAAVLSEEGVPLLSIRGLRLRRLKSNPDE